MQHPLSQTRYSGRRFDAQRTVRRVDGAGAPARAAHDRVREVLTRALWRAHRCTLAGAR